MGNAERFRRHRDSKRVFHMCVVGGCKKRTQASRCDEHAAEHAEAQKARRKALREAS